jgi:hypothetical protein
MPRALTQTQKDTVLAMLAASAAQVNIADAAKCSIKQVKRIKKNMHLFGRPEAPKLKPQGRPRFLTQEAIDVCLPPAFLMNC